MLRILPRILVVLVTLVVSLSTASATTALFVTDAEQAEISTAVVIAKVAGSEVLPHDKYETLMTRTQLQVEEVLFGSAPSEVLLHQVGGTLDGKTIHVPGDARFELGERCVLFLRHVEGRWYLTAMEQSKYLIAEHPKFGLLMKRTLGEGIVTRNSEGALVDYEQPIRIPLKRVVAFRALMKQLATEKGEQR